MDYEIVERKEKTVVGLSVRTSNGAADCGQKISGLWTRFLSAEDALPGYHPGDPTYGLYTHYTLDDGGYDAAVCCAGENCPEGYARFTIPAGRYACFHFHGHIQKDVAGFWQKIRELPLERAYRVDLRSTGKWMRKCTGTFPFTSAWRRSANPAGCR